MTTLGLKAKRSRRLGGPNVGRPGFAWAVPAALFFALFAILPLVIVAVLSFTSWNGLGDPQFNGITNWQNLVADPTMIQSLWITVLLVVLGVVVQTPISLLIGVWAAGQQRNRAVLTAIYFIPLLLSSAAISVLWHALLDPNFGIPNQVPWILGGGGILTNQATAIGVLTFIGAWQFIPLHTLIYQGAARAIPPVLYQAAQIDGAGTIRQFFSITIPQLRNSMITSIILMLVGGLTAFDTVLIVTVGGPGTATTSTAFYMYQKAFLNFDFGTASAIGLVLAVVATAISLIVTRVTGYDKMRSTQEGL
jgi:xylobiose transport system permease protein